MENDLPAWLDEPEPAPPEHHASAVAQGQMPLPIERRECYRCVHWAPQAPPCMGFCGVHGRCDEDAERCPLYERRAA